MHIIEDKNQLKKIIQDNDLQKLMSINLSEISNIFYFKKGEYIMRQCTLTNHLFFLISGKAEVYAYISEDRIHCKQYFVNCEVIGEIDALWNEEPISNVLALSDCLCIGIDLKKYRELLLNDSTFLRYISRVLALRLKDKTTTRNRLIPLETRLVNYILDFQSNNIIEMNLTVVSELLDSSYRHFLRNVTSLCDKGIIKKVKRGKYKILNMQALLDLR